MPDIDVSELLFDPDFAETLECLRQIQTVSDRGIATNTPQSFPFFGVVTADRGTEMARLAAGSRVSGSILINTVFRLSEGLAGRDADVVIWNGARYTVVSVSNYSRYGAGFVCASCDLIPLAGSAPWAIRPPPAATCGRSSRRSRSTMQSSTRSSSRWWSA